jgi:hypothetical protein
MTSTLQKFLIHLNTSQDLLESLDEKPNPERSGFVNTVAKLLQQKERKAVEEAVDGLLEDMKASRQDLTRSIQEELVAAQIEIPDASRTHPLRPEETIAAIAWAQSKAPNTSEHFERHLQPFADSPLLLHYFLVYLEWRSHEPTDEMLGAALLPSARERLRAISSWAHHKRPHDLP